MQHPASIIQVKLGHMVPDYEQHSDRHEDELVIESSTFVSMQAKSFRSVCTSPQHMQHNFESVMARCIVNVSNTKGRIGHTLLGTHAKNTAATKGKW